MKQNITAVIFDMQETLFSNGRLYPDTLGFLTKLKENGCCLAILSNAPKDNIEKLTESLKIDTFFDCAISARDYGLKKPDPRLIGITLAELSDKCGEKIDRSQAVFIGDRPYTDIRCAKAGGVKSIRVLRGVYASEMPEDSKETPDYEVMNFKQAEELLL